jgi:monoterpene epsilon-lactone hydrolase
MHSKTPPTRAARNKAARSHRTVCVRYLSCLCAITLAAGFGAASAASVEQDGTLHIAAFDMPFSDFASPEAKASFIRTQKQPLAMYTLPPTTPVSELRRVMDETYFNPRVVKQRAAFHVTMTNETIAGVKTEIFVPSEGVAAQNKHRILINLHGGAFIMGAHTESQIEAIPIAGTARIKVISVDYRQAPEFHFPAANEDVAAVYRELLKSYKPGEIGIYGCSAGGILTGQVMAWFQKVGLPNPAAIGMFCASTNDGRGDSAYTAPRLGSVNSAPPSANSPTIATLPYFKGVSANDPLVFPSASKAVLAKFPPTLLIVGSRDVEASAASRTHIDLVRAGVDARFFCWDGLDHNFMSEPELPESKEAYDIVTKFFEEQFQKASH